MRKRKRKVTRDEEEDMRKNIDYIDTEGKKGRVIKEKIGVRGKRKEGEGKE